MLYQHTNLKLLSTCSPDSLGRSLSINDSGINSPLQGRFTDEPIVIQNNKIHTFNINFKHTTRVNIHVSKQK